VGVGLKIAVIGWGSLYWNPGELAIEPDWHLDGPMLPVEFARFSSGDRLTLVLADGVPVQPTLWAASRKATLEDVAADLETREGCRDPRGIASWPRLSGRSGVRRYDEVIRNWIEAKKLDGAVWTALGPKGPAGERELLSSEIRLEYLRGLIASGRDAAAREYFDKAPEQIATPFRGLVKRELGWGQGRRMHESATGPT
jgi:hypothetical protein